MIRLRARIAARDIDVDLTLDEGVTTAIAGPNGSGKSTVLAVLAGLLVPDEGELVIGDDVLMDAGVFTAPHRRGIVLMSQRVLLFPHMSVRENVAFGPRSQGRSRADARAAADHWLEEVGMTAFATRRATALSGGQAQRVALARARGGAARRGGVVDPGAGPRPPPGSPSRVFCCWTNRSRPSTPPVFRPCVPCSRGSSPIAPR